MIDNVDSFVWNLVRYLQLADAQVEICRNDQLDFEKISQAGYCGAILSPGPGTPAKAGQLLPFIRRFQGKIPMLGVCLGHQAIAEAFGARIICSGKPLHGKITAVNHDGLGIYQGLPNPLKVTRYHSLIVEPGSFSADLVVACKAQDGTIMGVRHESGLLEGVQFHPEAELTEHGLLMIRQFVRFCRQQASKSKSAGQVDAG